MSSGNKLKAVPMDSDSSSGSDDNELVEKRIKLIRELSELEQEPRSRRFVGGIVVKSDSDDKDLSASASLSAAEKKGQKEVLELERELDLRNTFSEQTNRRDEDAEMNKYIDEQIRLKRQAARLEHERKARIQQRRDKNKDDDQEDDDCNLLTEQFALPAEASDKIEDILLNSLAKNLEPKRDEKSEAMLSSQMLNGIPEVDLGIDERIRTIEATEEAKLRLASSGRSKHSRRAPV